MVIDTHATTTAQPDLIDLAWQSGQHRVRANGEWWSGASVFLRLPHPVHPPVVGWVNGQKLYQLRDVTCTAVLPEWMADIEAIGEQRGKPATISGPMPTPPDRPMDGFLPAPFTMYRFDVDGGWYAVNPRVVTFLLDRATPDRWRAVNIPPAPGSGTKRIPTLLAYQGSRLVGGCTPFFCEGSLVERPL